MVKTPASPQKRKRQRRSFRTEERLLAAVLALADRGGLDACTVPAVAERAGVAVGTIYRRYPDKDALVAAAFLDFASLGDGKREAEYAAFAASARNLPDFLRRVGEAAVRVACEHRGLLLAIRAFARTTPDRAWRTRFARQQSRGRATLLKAALARFGPEIAGGEAALRFSLAALYGAVEVTWLEPQAGLFASRPSRSSFVAAIVEMQAAYLSKRPRP
ncbi:MAG: helix-turn-helix domain-containing protein [Rhizomicrobium sp.]